MNGSRLTGLTCSKVPGFWMAEHQLVPFYSGSLPVDWLLELSVVNAIISSSVIVVTTCTFINTNMASEGQKLVDKTVIGKQRY